MTLTASLSAMQGMCWHGTPRIGMFQYISKPGNGVPGKDLSHLEQWAHPMEHGRRALRREAAGRDPCTDNSNICCCVRKALTLHDLQKHCPAGQLIGWKTGCGELLVICLYIHSSNHPFIHLFNKCLLNFHSMPGAKDSTRDGTVNQ